MAKAFGAEFILHLGDFDYDGTHPWRHGGRGHHGATRTLRPLTHPSARVYVGADEPDTFFPSIWNIMGRDYPYFAAIGNNDEDAWDGNGYAPSLP